MTPAQVIELAIDILGSHGLEAPNIARSVLYTRMSQQQRVIFTWADGINPEYFGVCATAILDADGNADLNILEDSEDVYPIESIQVIRVLDVGTRGDDYESGARIRIVPADDTRELPPRMTLRSKVLRSVGTDLAGVVSIMVWYSRRPRAIGVDGTGVVELIEPFDMLLATDLARIMCERYPEAATQGAVDYLDKEEARLLAMFEAHIRGTYRTIEARFPPPKPKA